MIKLSCNACKGELPVSSFHKAATITRGYQYKCKACMSILDTNLTPERKEHKLKKLEQWRIDNPDKKKEQKRRHYEKNKEKYKIIAKLSQEKNKERYASLALIRKYGITLNQYNWLREQQNYCCAICGESEAKYEKKLVVDHDHETGKIRKLLCTNCNVGIGMLKDNPNILDSAAKYLREHNG